MSRKLPWRGVLVWFLAAAIVITAVTLLAPVAAALAPLMAAVVLPVTGVGAIGMALAWAGGWQPGRLYRCAAWSLPAVTIWLAVAAGARLPALPSEIWHVASRGDDAAAIGLALPLALPAGLLAGGVALSRRLRSMSAGTRAGSPGAAISFDRRQWRYQVRSARARLASPVGVPLLTRRGDFVAGAVIRAVGHPDQRLARLPVSRLRAHQLVIGSTGSGKTTLLIRLWAGFMAAGSRQHTAGSAGSPLLVVLDCKGGADARRIADRCRQVLHSETAGNVVVWPDEVSLSLWSLPVRQLVTTLVDLIEHGTGGAAYYADVMEAVVALAVEAPGGPPVSTADFLARLDLAWLAHAWLGDATRLALVRSAARQLPDVALRFRTLFRRLGTGLDGPGGFADADAWYCILEGTAEIAVAEAQARALVDMLASYVVGAYRPVLLVVDEFSAVSRRLPIWQLYERARSLGLAVYVSAQSWHGLAAREDDRYRLAATAEGGIWLLRTPHPDPVTALAGQRRHVDSTVQTTRRPRGRRSVSVRVTSVAVADADLIRGLDVGQAAYLYRGGVTYAQIKPLVRTAAAAPTDQRVPATAPLAADLPVPGPPAAEPSTSGAAWEAPPAGDPAAAGVSEFLDEAFGPARPPGCS